MEVSRMRMLVPMCVVGIWSAPLPTLAAGPCWHEPVQFVHQIGPAGVAASDWRK